MRLTLLSLAAILLPAMAHAYVGPGAGLGSIVVVLALVFGFLLLIVGFLWYPLKRFIRGRKAKPDTPSQD
jgi:flagellar biogenesis protein FliO|tara:strand:- start:1708 stop:1917 length:210 start_codon:yes stop_codon:yes gene_type:complete